MRGINLCVLIFLGSCAASAQQKPSQGLAAAKPNEVPEGNALTAAQVQRDIALVREAMVEAYAGRVFNTEATWTLFSKELADIPNASHTQGSLCRAIGDALTRLTNPALFATPRFGSRCSRKATGGGLPYDADKAGSNVAVNAARAYALFLQKEPSFAVLGVRAFAPPSHPAWEGFADAVAALSGADAIVIDLRNARGNDPRGALPLISALTGYDVVRPLRSIDIRKGPVAEGLRRQRQIDTPSYRPREPEAWRSLVGPKPPAENPEP